MKGTNRILYFEESINYKFNDIKNLFTALSHSSYVNENKNEKLDSNERLEYLGDSILNFVISEKIFRNCSHFTEGSMTKIRASIVCEASLFDCANKMNIGEYLMLGRGEELSGGRKRESILADALEALIGAVYIDGGLESAKEFILLHMATKIDEYMKGTLIFDYKTEFQEVIQSMSDKKIGYQVIQEKGPDHSKIFVSQVKVGDDVVGIGEGRTKKEAEQSAARCAMGKMGKLVPKREI